MNIIGIATNTNIILERSQSLGNLFENRLGFKQYGGTPTREYEPRAQLYGQPILIGLDIDEPGKGLIKNGKQIIPFDNQINKNSAVYKLFSTKMADQKKE